jgi:hypothetical protein
MKLLYCLTCGTYTLKANFDFETRHPGKLVRDNGGVVIKIGGRSLPETVPISKAQAAYCMVCGTELEIQEVDPCPHESDDRYWIVNPDARPPSRKCELCQIREQGRLVVEFD